MGILVISRHGESEWNLLGKWTGWTDVNLTEKGHNDTVRLGALLKGLSFNEAYTSSLNVHNKLWRRCSKGAESKIYQRRMQLS